jgi:hypothetical protein
MCYWDVHGSMWLVSEDGFYLFMLFILLRSRSHYMGRVLRRHIMIGRSYYLGGQKRGEPVCRGEAKNEATLALRLYVK